MYTEVGQSVFALFFVSTAFASTTEKSIDYQYCHKSDPKFNECLKNTFQKAMPQLINGYQKYRIPTLDPFYLPLIEVTKGQGVVSIDLSLQKIRIYGLTKMIFDRVNLDPENLSGTIKFHYDTPIHLIGNYTAKGKVQILPINGRGYCNITMENVKVELINLQGESFEKKGVKYIRVKNVDLKRSTIKRLHVQLDNLFPGNKDISDNLNLVLNDNWEALFDELEPVLRKTIIEVIKEVASNILSKIPQNTVFPA